MTRKRLPNWRRWTPWILLGVYWVLIFVLTHLSPLRLGRLRFHGHEVFLHFSAYFVLTLLYWFARYGTQPPRPGTLKPYLCLGLLALYAMIDEISQSFIGRDASLIDWSSDMAGCVTALLGLLLVRRWWAWLILYWAGFFLLTHMRLEKPLLQILPSMIEQFRIAYLLIGYVILTLLWVRTVSRSRRFVINSAITGGTFFVLGGYAVLEHFLSQWTNRAPFGAAELIGSLIGIALGLIAAAVFAR